MSRRGKQNCSVLGTCTSRGNEKNPKGKEVVTASRSYAEKRELYEGSICMFSFTSTSHLANIDSVCYRVSLGYLIALTICC